ncbi:hypothetical protein DSO57_1031084 [Entomophthora muscae]|uniref:Uncharacterized protein n=1 Tax=Entomophthora muscae TaxID=34485 RepID=A0ACC2UAK0_9FUNG|nr:hypothetical protein DSO57_1031084 [Entomophthora muscae]
MAFSPDAAIEWANQGFTPRDARRRSFIGISPEEGRKLREARWNPDNVHLWGSFKDWTPEDATSWKANGYTHVEMKYWIGLGTSMDIAQSWQRAGVTTQLHKTLENKKFTLEDWGKWRHTTTLADAAAWQTISFNPDQATPWIEHKVSPTEAVKLVGQISPADANTWLNAGIQAEHILKWRTLLPEAMTAGLFAKALFTPEEVAEWYDLGASPDEATTFKQGGWNPVTVTNWLHTNHLLYQEINKYIHPTIDPESAIEWKSKGLLSTEAKQWTNIRVQVDLASSLRDPKIYPSTINNFLLSGYTLNESVEYNIKKIPLKQAPPPKLKHFEKNMSYSERVRQGLETELKKDGFVPYEDFLRELATQGNPYKTIPRSSLNHAIRIHVNNLSKGSIKKCMETIFDALDTSFPALQVDNHLAVSEGYLDIGFDSDEQKKKHCHSKYNTTAFP